MQTSIEDSGDAGAMTLPDILDSFEKALILERDLGTRRIECDRTLLRDAPPRPASAEPPDSVAKVAAAVTVPPAPAASAVSAEVSAPVRNPVPSDAGSHANDSLALIANEIAGCIRCGLHGQRTKTVPGQGNADGPDFMFIGEAPGAEEDRAGEAFVGAAGRLLTRMIEAMGYSRGQVFIANICKCRPVNNRTPTPEEMGACVPYLKRQIACVKPRCIVLLGRTAMSGLFPEMRIRRGAWYAYEGIPVIATFHPAYILRFDPVSNAAGSRAAKLEVWNTLKLALARLGKKPPRG